MTTSGFATLVPVNDHQVEFVDNLETRIWVEENSQTCLSLQNLDATDADIGRDSIIFEIVRRPIRGQLLTRGETAQQFDRSDLSSGVICYKQGIHAPISHQLESSACTNPTERAQIELSASGA